jgi:hypothetical protein
VARIETGYSYEELAKALGKSTPEEARKAERCSGKLPIRVLHPE